jgi:hypothetical protein
MGERRKKAKRRSGAKFLSLVSPFISILGILTAGVAVASVLSLPQVSQVESASQTEPQDKPEARVRVAAGEYQVFKQTSGGGIGSYAPQVYNFRESWTLWRLPDGTLEIEGERDYESPQYEQHENRFSVRLTPDFDVTSVKEFRRLRWRPDSGPLSCEFLAEKLDCNSGAKDPANAIHLEIPVREASAILWPISAFTLSNLTRHAGRTPNAATPVQLVTFEEHSRQNPVDTSVLDGKLTYSGQKELNLADHKWLADEFVLKVPFHPAFLLWISREGLLLSFAPESEGNEPAGKGLQLVHFEQWTKF